MNSILSSKSRTLFESMPFSALHSHVSSLLCKIWWCTETTGTKLGDIGKGWKCSLARARCGIQRAYSGVNMHEWFDISNRLVKRINLSLVKRVIEWKCFSFLILIVLINLVLNKIGQSRGFTFLHIFFLLPRIKARLKINIYLSDFKLTSFIWIKSSLVLFLEHFVKISLVDVFCALNPYLCELKVGTPFSPPNHKIASW